MDDSPCTGDPPPPDTGVPATVQRLVDRAADNRAAKVQQVDFDASQRAMSRPPHWPADTCFGPGEYCTARYMITDYLGRGGIAQVFEARDMLEETYEALKIARIDGVRAEIVEKVAAEAASLKKIDHPYVLRVHDAGLLEEKMLLWVAMERLVGGTLQQRIARAQGPAVTPRRPAIPVIEALRIGAAIARGLHAIHKHGIVHRDIKPENVFLTKHVVANVDAPRRAKRDGLIAIGETEGGVSMIGVKVIDLNIAKFTETLGVRTTEPGITMGTVLYMSPEHLHEGTADRRSDIYAVGLVLFEMIAGHHAFASGPRDVPSSNDAIAWHKTRMPPRLAKLIEGVPIALDGIIKKCVEKEPEKRFQDCQALIDDLTALESLLVQAEEAAAQLAARSFGPATKKAGVVVRAEGVVSSPRLPLATTEQTATAIPSVPLEILPPPIFDPPAQGAGGTAQLGAHGAAALAAVPEVSAQPAAAAAAKADSASGASGPRPVASPSGPRSEAPAAVPASGPAGTEVIVPVSSRDEARAARRKATGTQSLPLETAPAMAGPTWLVGESAPPSEREGEGGGTAELHTTGVVESEGDPPAAVGGRPAAARATAGPAAAASAPAPASRVQPSSRRGRGGGWRALPYLLCVVASVAASVALTSLTGRWRTGDAASFATAPAPAASASAVSAAPAGSVAPAVTASAAGAAPAVSVAPAVTASAASTAPSPPMVPVRSVLPRSVPAPKSTSTSKASKPAPAVTASATPTAAPSTAPAPAKPLCPPPPRLPTQPCRRAP